LKDLKTEFRTKQMLNTMIIFSILVIVIFSFSFRESLGDQERITELTPGILWIAFTFAGMLGLSRAFVSEKEDGCLDGLKLCPIDRSLIYVGKVISNIVLMFIIETVTLIIFIVLFNYSFKGILALASVIIVGTFGFIFVGTLLSALTVNTRTREILLPVLLISVLIPMIMSAVGGTSKVLSNNSFPSTELNLLIVYDIIYFIVAMLVFEYAIED
ncbi:MAG: heme exporter protein CcmB, partial [Methanosarcinales archaeon]